MGGQPQLSPKGLSGVPHNPARIAGSNSGSGQLTPSPQHDDGPLHAVSDVHERPLPLLLMAPVVIKGVERDYKFVLHHSNETWAREHPEYFGHGTNNNIVNSIIAGGSHEWSPLTKKGKRRYIVPGFDPEGVELTEWVSKKERAGGSVEFTCLIDDSQNGKCIGQEVRYKGDAFQGCGLHGLVDEHGWFTLFNLSGDGCVPHTFDLLPVF